MNAYTFVGLPGVYRAKVLKNIKKINIQDEIIETSVKKHIEHPGDIIDLCCEHFDIQKKDLLGPSRKARFIRPRKMCISVIILMFPNETLKNVGRMFNRDHSTIITARDVTNDYITTDPAFRFDYNSFLNRI